MTDNWDSNSISGLISILDNSRTPVARACAAVEECIAANRDNLRGFFEQCFPALLRRLFGYDGASWLTQVAKGGSSTDIKALLRLLSPTGTLFSAMYSADADGSTRFHFPRERLPTHTQMMLATTPGRTVLESWPQYARTLVPDATGKPHVHVGVFQYFLYWFAFYAMKGGDGGSSGSGFGTSTGAGGHGFHIPYPSSIGASAAGFGSSVRKAADALNFATRGRDDAFAGSHPYIALVRQFMADVLPRPSAGGVSSTGGVSPAPTKPSTVNTPAYYRSASGIKGDTRLADVASRGCLFLSILLEFWLSDADEPVPVTNTSTLGGVGGDKTSTGGLWATTTYEPPCEDLLEALTEVIRYVVSDVNISGEARPAQASTAWLPVAPNHILTSNTAGGGASNKGIVSIPSLNGPYRLGAAAQPGSQTVARRLFRFFHRGFTLWPDQRSIKVLLRPFISYVAPWQSHGSYTPPSAATVGSATTTAGKAFANQLTAVTELVHRVGAQKQSSGSSGLGYTADWQSHVLANLPFYLVLYPRFLELSISRVAARGEPSALDVVTVFNTLAASSELIDMLQRIERDLTRYATTQPRRAEGPYAELLPWLYDQMQDWVGAATSNCVGDTSTMASGLISSSFTTLSSTTPSTHKSSNVGFISTMFSTTAETGAGYAAREVLELSGRVLKEEPFNKLKKCLETVLPLDRLMEHPSSAAARALELEQQQWGLGGGFPRLPKSNWKDVVYKGDPLKKPVATFESALLARIFVALSIWLNEKLGLDKPLTQQELDQGPENRLQEIVFRLRQKGRMINLRPFADIRTLMWIPIAYFVVTTMFKVLWIIFSALLSVPSADEAFGSPPGGQQRYQQQQRNW